jgi:uncharacterized protein YggE
MVSLVHGYGCCDANTLQIVGAATVQVQPDLAQFTVSAEGDGATSASALTNVNKLISQAMAILKSYGLPAANYTTSSIDLSPQYNYSNGYSQLVGQQATQTLAVTVGSLSTNKNILGSIATALSYVNNLTISGFSFTASNTSAAYRLARKTAVSNAQQSASQYCSLSGLHLGAVRKVVDQNQ